MSGCAENFSIVVFLNAIRCDKCQALHDVLLLIELSPLSVSLTMIISRSEHCQMVLTENCMLLPDQIGIV